MFEISKEFPFEFGHRVWTQKLNKEFSIDNKCVCKHLHGHSGVLKVYLIGENLTDGFITDFKHLNFVKKFIDENLDHKFLIDINDPLFNNLVGEDNLINVRAEWNRNKILFIRKSLLLDVEEYMQEYLESFIILDFVPTSENLCKWFYDIISERMKDLNINVSRVEFKETQKTLATYYGHDKLK